MAEATPARAAESKESWEPVSPDSLIPRPVPGLVLARVVGFPASAGLLDLEVRGGEVVLLAGPNGSGKTSLLRSLAGLPAPLAPRSAEVAGEDPRRMPATRLAATVGVALQDPRESLVGLTVRSEFRLRGHGVPDAVAAWADRDVATLSSGEARRVSLAAAEAATPPLLLLDEPTEGLDAEARGRLLALVAAVRERGGAVVAADHAGLLDGVASRRVELATRAPPQPVALPPPGEATLLRAPAMALRLGGTGRADAGTGAGATDLALPAVELPAGFHAVVGPNGSGKSTLLLRLAGLRHSEGVELHGGPPEPGRDARLLLPHAGDLFTTARVEDELGGPSPDPDLAPDALLGRHPLALSAGEAQRVALAKVLGRPARLYLLDEPEARLDAAGRAQMMRLVAHRVAQGAVVVAATHDPALVASAHRVVRIVLEVR
jgi:energy-coupling factor transporter ATP-binding protein EcfA2